MSIFTNSLTRRIFRRFLMRNPKLRLKITKLLLRDENLTVDMFGSRLAINSIKEIGYLNAAKANETNVVARDEAASLINLALIVEAGDTFLDIGANVGLYSGILGRIRRLFPDLLCYAFEANPDTFQRLKQTVEPLGVKAECIALSNRETTLEFCSGAVSGAFGNRDSAIQPEFQIRTDVVSVPAQRLDQFPIRGDSLVMKIDVEGHEWEVLQGAERFFAERRVKAVYLDGFRDQRIPHELEQRGFICFDGRTLERPPTQNFSHLWIRSDWVEKRTKPSA